MSVRYLLLVVAVGCATSDRDVIDEVVSDELIAPCPVGQWCIETATTSDSTRVSALLRGVWAVSPDDVFAVGHGGTILHRTGSAWTVMPSGTTSNLHAVWAASSSDVWAAGAGGIVLHFNGTAWSTVPSGRTVDVDAVWGSSATDVWFAGSTQVTRWNGTGMSKSLEVGGLLLSISGTSPNDVWTTGENTFLRHFTGSWQPTIKPIAGVSTMSAVLAIATNDVWVSEAVPGKETLRSTNGGASWTPHPASNGGFKSLSARASNDILGVGGTSVGHWDGSAWAIATPFGSTVSIQSVTTTPPTTAGQAWLVGENGLIAHLVL